MQEGASQLAPTQSFCWNVPQLIRAGLRTTDKRTEGPGPNIYQYHLEVYLRSTILWRSSEYGTIHQVIAEASTIESSMSIEFWKIWLEESPDSSSAGELAAVLLSWSICQKGRAIRP